MIPTNDPPGQLTTKKESEMLCETPKECKELLRGFTLRLRQAGKTATILAYKGYHPQFDK